MAARSEKLYVVTGKLFKPYKDKRDLRYRLIGLNRIAVPTHLYKVILHRDMRGNMLMEVFAVQNSNLIDEAEDLEKFRIDVENDLGKLEKVTSLKFFDILDRTKIWTPPKFQYGFVGNYENYDISVAEAGSY